MEDSLQDEGNLVFAKKGDENSRGQSGIFRLAEAHGFFTAKG